MGAPDIFGSGENNTFVDLKMPYDVFLDHTNLSDESSMRLIFGTSTQNTPNLKADIGNTDLDGDIVNVSDSETFYFLLVEPNMHPNQTYLTEIFQLSSLNAKQRYPTFTNSIKL